MASGAVSTGFTPIHSGDPKGAKQKQKTRAAKIVSLYAQPPPYDAALEELETFSLDRLKVLRGIERARLSNSSEADVRKKTKELLRKYASEGDELRRDQISHFMLRLAYCQTEDLRRWLVDQEADLFKVRFEELVHKEQKDFLQEIDLKVGVVEQEEYERVKSGLSVVHGKSSNATHRDFFKVPFEAVPSLVSTRRVFLHKGWAYVGANQMGPLVVGHFKAHLRKALQTAAKSWPHVAATDETNRLAPIVAFLSKQYLGPDYSEVKANGSSAATLEEIPALSRSHFPLCMKHLYNSLQSNNHLRHQGRMQFGLFLKGIGLPLDSALQFWKRAFAPKVQGDKFDKQYAYNIRHNYGKEGKRADYTPYTCMKVISSTPGSGEYHGCPYKTFSESNLRATLQQLHISGSDQKQVVELAKNHHYQLACGKVFQLTHNGVVADEGINHPNQFYDLSRQCCSKNDALAPATPGFKLTNE